jgi:hypothetical protein
LRARKNSRGLATSRTAPLPRLRAELELWRGTLAANRVPEGRTST